MTKFRRGLSVGLLASAALAWMPLSADAAQAWCAGRRATIVGTEAGEVIEGTSGPDVIVAKGGSDRVISRSGNDRICGDAGRDVVYAGSGADKIFGGEGRDLLVGGSGNDRINGARRHDLSADVLRGGRGRDRLIGLESGRDRYLGGRGIDLLDFSLMYVDGPTQPKLQVDLGAGAGSVGEAHAFSVGGVENVTASYGATELRGNGDRNVLVAVGSLFTPIGAEIDGRAGPDHIIGTFASDHLLGSDGNDVIEPKVCPDPDDFGYPAEDVVQGGDGDDRIYVRCSVDQDDSYAGDLGADSIDFRDYDDGVVIDLGQGTIVSHHGFGLASVLTVENVYGSFWPDSLTGDDLPNRLLGEAGADSISGLGGDDYLDGGPGTDQLNGGSNTDTCVRGEDLTECEA